MATYRVRVALNLKGVAAEEVAVDLDAGAQLAPAFLAINPEGAVPALVIAPGEPPITQSMAILEYLEERFPEPPLLPADLPGRARVRSLAALIVSDMHPLIVPRVRAYLTDRAGFDDADFRAWGQHWMTRAVAAFEARLAADAETGAFCHGDEVTLADVCLASFVSVARGFGFARRDTPTVTHIVERCEALDAFARASPTLQAGAPA